MGMLANPGVLVTVPNVPHPPRKPLSNCIQKRSVVYEGVWFSAGGLRQGERSGKIPVIDTAVGDEDAISLMLFI